MITPFWLRSGTRGVPSGLRLLPCKNSVGHWVLADAEIVKPASRA
jgi:hypothetical protein